MYVCIVYRSQSTQFRTQMFKYAYAAVNINELADKEISEHNLK